MTTVEETQELIRQVQELISQAPDDASLPPILAELQQTLNLLLSGAEEGPQQQQKEAAADTLRPPPIGSKCAIPFPSDEDEDDDQYYLLLGVVISYNNTNDEATVILATPITQDTVPCPVFLSGSQECLGPCPYNQSHGYTVPVDMLLPYEAMDIANVYAYNRVWVRQPNQLWVRGRLVNISSNNDEDNTATCQVISDQGDHPTFTVGIDSIVPRITLDDYDEDDDDEDDENEDEDEDDIGSELEEEERLQMETIGRINADEWGGWQTHTTGFGAKMLAKMGYVHGQGLGRHGQGRVEPVQAYIKKGRRGPDSRSGLGVLDKVKKKNKKRRRKRRSSNNNAQQQQKAILSSSVSSKSNQTAVFDFVNILLKSQDTKIPSAPAAQETSSSSRNDTQPPSSKSGKKEASYRSLAKLQAEIETTSKQFAHSLEALRRNKGTIMEYKFKEKSKAIKQKLDALQIEANAMESSLKRAKDQEKMVSF